MASWCVQISYPRNSYLTTIDYIFFDQRATKEKVDRTKRNDVTEDNNDDFV